jgi:putative colanic acid biosysnthesis UDP-glucose lipid carrier transferase
MKPFATLLKLLDPFAIALTGLLSYYIRFDTVELETNYQAAILGAFGLSVVVFAAFDVYRWRAEEGLRHSVISLLCGWFGVILGIVVLMYITKTGSAFSRQWLGVWSVLAFAALILARVVVVALLRTAHDRGLFNSRIAVAGAGTLGREVVRRLPHGPGAGLEVMAFFDDASTLHGTTVEGIPVRGDIDAVKTLIRQERFDEVWIALPLRAEDRIKQLLRDLVPLNVKVRFVPAIYDFPLLNQSITEIGGMPVINVTEPPLSGFKGALKWLEDKVVATLILALIWPLLLVLVIGVKLSSPGPVIFRQRRGGLDNHDIVVWKFRTMALHEEKATGNVPQATKNDPRVTRFGAFLRRTSLDELPQLINVLMGDMSIVGPRPHPLWLNEFYHDKIPTYMLRSWIKPGITGWAQISGWRGETDEIWKMEMRVQHDLYYIENWSLGLDLYIIVLTLFRLRSPQAY